MDAGRKRVLRLWLEPLWRATLQPRGSIRQPGSVHGQSRWLQPRVQRAERIMQKIDNVFPGD
jgi:hypothetical protein